MGNPSRNKFYHIYPTDEAVSTEAVVGYCGIVVLAYVIRLLEGAALAMPILTWRKNREELAPSSEDEVSVELLQDSCQHS